MMLRLVSFLSVALAVCQGLHIPVEPASLEADTATLNALQVGKETVKRSTPSDEAKIETVKKFGLKPNPQDGTTTTNTNANFNTNAKKNTGKDSSTSTIKDSSTNAEKDSKNKVTTPSKANAQAQKAKSSEDGNDLKHANILVGVVSSPNHKEARKAIRETWAKADLKKKSNIEVKFFIGELGEDQKGLEGDLNSEPGVVRLTGFVESYHNLTAKSLGVLDWAAQNNYEAVFKTDDDTFVSLDRLRKFVTGKDLNSLYSGFINRHLAMVTDTKSKWYFSDQYPESHLPDYAIGGGYLVGKKALTHIHANKGSLKLYRVEDAAVGIWTKDLGMNIMSMPSNVYSKNLNRDSIWYNPVNANEMKLLMENPENVLLQECESSCLCDEDPQAKSECWKKFQSSEYTDMGIRLAW